MPARLPSTAPTSDDRLKKASRGQSVLHDINSRAVLKLLRLYHPCSCSDLARYSGFSALSILSLILNRSLIVFGGNLGMHPALLRAVSARLAEHDFAHPRLAITQLGPQVELRDALCLALQTAEAALP